MRKRRIKFDLSRLKWREAMKHTAQPWPMWFPDDEDLRRANITQFCRRVGLDSLAALYEWSINQPGDFWAVVVDQLGIKFQTPPDRTLNLDDGVASARWLEGASWNIVESCFQRDDGEVAVICGDHSGALTTVSVADLRRDMLRVAQSLRDSGFVPGDAIAIMMPMNYESVMIYLGILAAGCVAVSIADSFAAPAIRRRLELADAKAIICQRSFVRAGKVVDIWSRVAEAQPAMAIVIGNGGRDGLRDHDLAWQDFLVGMDADDVRRRSFPSRFDGNHQRTFLIGNHGGPQGHPLEPNDRHQIRGGRLLPPRSPRRGRGRLADQPGLDDGTVVGVCGADQSGHDRVVQ